MTIKEIKKEYHPDEKAQNAIWVHACLNLKRAKELVALLPKEPEICVSKITDKKYFNNFGFYVKGEVTLMAKSDIGSKYDPETGERVFDENLPVEKILVKKYDDLKHSEESSYTESFLKVKEIIGVWIYDYYYKRLIEDIEDGFKQEKALLDYLQSLGNVQIIKSGLI